MNLRRLWAVPILLPALALTGCGGGALDDATAAGLQADVRRIADAAASEDFAGAITLARAMDAEVADARAAGNLTEDRATVIGMQIGALISSLEAGEVQPGEVQPDEGAPTTGSPAPQLGTPAPDQWEPVPETPEVPEPVQPEPVPEEVVPVPEVPAPAPGDGGTGDGTDGGVPAAPPPEDLQNGVGTTPGNVSPGNSGNGNGNGNGGNPGSSGNGNGHGNGNGNGNGRGNGR